MAIPTIGLRVVLVALTASAAFCQSIVSPSPPPIQVLFSPRGGCTEAIVKALDSARESLLIQAYSFTSAPIAQAVVSAHKRGVRVQVVLDKSQRTEKYSSADFLANFGVAVWIDAKHKIAHNKVMVIDSGTVITGSFNFSKAAENDNAENLLVIRDAVKAALYEQNWKEHQGHSESYKMKTPTSIQAQLPTEEDAAPIVIADSRVQGAPASPAVSAASPGGATVATYFAPKGGGMEAIEAAIDGARSRVWVLTQALSSRPIGAALARAFARRVDVKIIFDPTPRTESRAATLFARLGDVAWVDSDHAYLTNNCLVIDEDKVFVSTAPFTKAADVASGATIVFITSERTAADVAKNWEAHRNHATRQRTDGGAPLPADGPATKFWLIQAGQELFIVEVSDLSDGIEAMDVIRPLVDRNVGMQGQGLADTLEKIKQQAERVLQRSRNLRLRPGVY